MLFIFILIPHRLYWPPGGGGQKNVGALLDIIAPPRQNPVYAPVDKYVRLDKSSTDVVEVKFALQNIKLQTFSFFYIPKYKSGKGFLVLLLLNRIITIINIHGPRSGMLISDGSPIRYVDLPWVSDGSPIGLGWSFSWALKSQ